VLIALPTVAFIIIVSLFSFAFHHYSVLVVCIVAGWYVLAAFFAWLHSRGRMGGRWYLYLATLCFCACFWGTVAGIHNYRKYMFQYWSYEERRVYTNVLPTEMAAALADAGKIVFSNSARIDTTRAVGFKSGSTYCVAPILDDAQFDGVEFWAAGIDCCPMRGDFGCDDAWNPAAKGGLAVIEPNSFLPGPTNHEMYLKAVKLASGAFGLKTAAEPLLVRWIADPQAAQDEAWRSGIGFIIAAVFIYMFLSLVVGVVTHMMSRRAAMAEGAHI